MPPFERECGHIECHGLARLGTSLGAPVGTFDVFGSKAAITARGRLYLADLANHRASALGEGERYHGPMFSPDGQKLAVVRNLREMVVKNLRNGGDTLLYVAR